MDKSDRLSASLSSTKSRVNPNVLKTQSKFTASSRVTGMASKSVRMSTKSFASEQSAPPVIVKDEEGNIVTPKSLIKSRQSTAKSGQGAANTGGAATPSSESSDLFSEKMSSASFMGSLSSGGSTADVNEAEDSAVSPRMSTDDQLGDGTGGVVAEDDETRESAVTTEAAAKPVEESASQGKVALSESELSRLIAINIMETETIVMLDLPGNCVALDGSMGAELREVSKVKISADKLVERSMQTFNLPQKSKEIQAVPAQTKDTGVTATFWDICDSTQDPEESKVKVDGAQEGAAKIDLRNPDDPLLTEMEKESNDWLDSEAPDTARGANENSRSHAADGQSGDAKTSQDSVLTKFKRLPDSLRLCERMVTQNIFHTKQLIYRDLYVEKLLRSSSGGMDVSDIIHHHPPTPSLEFLWSFSCDLTKGRNVSCMAWNRVNQDVLAVGYGQYEFTKQKDKEGGLILCWSLKNPVYPERIIRTPSGVTSLDFSFTQPNLLAVGTYDGALSIFDVRRTDSRPVLESGLTSGKHADPVWEVKWIDRSNERGETLVSVSTDGRVSQWSIKKGLEFTDLMKLKRITNQAKTSDSKNEAFISRTASGLCIDFSPRDPTMYLCGTEDGNIHKCSCSYNEQYLENYFGHSGPIYRIRWSPFYHSTFLSASADWSVKLWKEDDDKPALVFQSYTDYVSDVSWSPFSSTVFCCVTGDGRVDIWDLHVSQHDPLITRREEGQKLSCVLFSHKSPIIVVGNDLGQVNVYKLKNVELFTNGRLSDEEQRIRLEKAMSSKEVSE